MVQQFICVKLSILLANQRTFLIKDDEMTGKIKMEKREEVGLKVILI